MAQYDSLCFRIGYYLYTRTPLGYMYHRQDVRAAQRKYERGHSACVPTTYGQLKIVPVPVALDNYAYLIVDEADGTAVLVDPSDAAVVQVALQELEVQPSAILTTHKHWDHSAGNEELRAAYPNLRVYSNAEDSVPGMTDHVADGARLVIGQRLQFTTLHTPGHTRGHVVFVLDGSPFGAPNSLFSGDLLFIGATGRAFECPAEIMLQSLDMVASLDGRTLLWPGHEYSLANLSFAATIDTTNDRLAAKLAWVKQMRDSAVGRCTCPSTISEELQYNPFLRTRNESTVKNVVTALGDADLKTRVSYSSTGSVEEIGVRAAVLECLLKAKRAYKLATSTKK